MKIKEIIENSLIPLKANEEEDVEEEENTLDAMIRKYMTNRKKFKKYSSVEEEINEYKVKNDNHSRYFTFNLLFRNWWTLILYQIIK